jgi:hypothetical protein
MNNTVEGISEKIPERLKVLYSCLLGDVIFIREQWQMYEMLYGQEEYWNLINKSAPRFFEMLDYQLVDYFILALSRLGDPADQRIKRQIVQNFTLEQLLLKLDQSSHAVLIQELKPLLDDYQRKCQTIREQRKKRVAHSDYNTKMEPGKPPLPDISRKMLHEALMAAEDYLNQFENHFSGKDCDPYREFSPDGADILLDRLYKANAYDHCIADGTIEPGFVHKLANLQS